MSKKPFSPVLFDVDGTLVQSGDLVMECFAQTLQELGLPPVAGPELRKVVGPPLASSFNLIGGVPTDQITKAVEIYRAHYLPRYLEPPLYPGIRELVRDLHDAGIPLATATSKMERSAKRQLEHWDIAQYFTVIAGATPDPTCTKVSVIIDALQRLSDKNISSDNAVLVGDRIFDAEGAEVTGIKAIAALWGYGEAEEFVSPAVIAQAASVEELRTILL